MLIAPSVFVNSSSNALLTNQWNQSQSSISRFTICTDIDLNFKLSFDLQINSWGNLGGGGNYCFS